MRSRFAVLVALLAGCSQSGSVSQQGAASAGADDAAAKAAVDAVNARWTRYTNAGQTDSLASLYTADGIAMPPNVPSATGHDSIAVRLKLLAIPNGVLTLNHQSTVVDGPVAVGYGTFAYAAPAQGKTPAIELRGKYMEHFHHVGDQWLIAQSIWNTDAPVPTELTPPAPKK